MEWKDGSCTRTYRLNASTVARLDRLVNETGLLNSELVECLLSTGLDCVEMGRWEIDTRPGRPELDGIRVR
jgi:hypothetical protein